MPPPAADEKLKYKQNKRLFQKIKCNFAPE